MSPYLTATFLCLLCFASARQLLETGAKTVTTSSTSVSQGGAVTSTSSSSIIKPAPKKEEKEEEPPILDIYLLVDITEAEPGRLQPLVEDAETIVDTIFSYKKAQMGLGTYYYSKEKYHINKTLDLTDKSEKAVDSLKELEFIEDDPKTENGFPALESVATEDVGFREDSVKILIWIGDTPSADKIGDVTEDTVLDALLAEEIRVLAIDTGSLDATEQATIITIITEGVLMTLEDDVNSADKTAKATSGDGGIISSTISTTGDFSFVSSFGTIGGDPGNTSVGSPKNVTEAVVEGIQAIVDLL